MIPKVVYKFFTRFTAVSRTYKEMYICHDASASINTYAEYADIADREIDI